MGKPHKNPQTSAEYEDNIDYYLKLSGRWLIVAAVCIVLMIIIQLISVITGH